MATGRGWGLWSQIKLDILRRYLDRFTTASKSVSEIIYLDLFAGEPQNFARTTGDLIIGSARLALDTTNPQFSRILLFELPANAEKLDEELRAAHPNRSFQILAGDCNRTLPGALADLRAAGVAWAPTFAFIDPDGPHCHWTTLEALAQHKPASSTTKVEFWVLFPTMFMRQLPLDGRQLDPANVQQITAMFGTTQWSEIHELRRAQAISGQEARSEYVNLMRWAIQNVLGYNWTHPLEIPNEQGNPIYTMIFATDHPAGTAIMTALYRDAARQFPVMRIQARRRREQKAREEAGISTLLDELDYNDLPDPSALPLGTYEYQPPHDPPGMIDEPDWLDPG